MLHMDYVDEVLFGSEVVQRIPVLVRGWVLAARERPRSASTPGAGAEPTPQGKLGKSGTEKEES